MTTPKCIPQEDERPPFFEKLEAGTASGTQQPPPDFEKLAEEVGTPFCDHTEYPLLEENYHLCRQIQREEVEDAIKQTRGGSAPGPDGIPAKALNVLQVILLPLLLGLYNLVMKEKKWPDPWKISVVIPLFKKGEASLCENYRPISLGNCLGKILDKILNKRLELWMLDLFFRVYN